MTVETEKDLLKMSNMSNQELLDYLLTKENYFHVGEGSCRDCSLRNEAKKAVLGRMRALKEAVAR